MQETTPAKLTVALLFCALAMVATDVFPGVRSKAVVREFQREVPCPATGKRRGNCQGYQADHVVPLCLGGADDWRNMQWLTPEAHRDKTRDDVRACAAIRRDRKAGR